MKDINIYSAENLAAYISSRSGETKLGEVVQTLSSSNTLKTSHAKYVLLGIPEDIGVSANRGKKGSAKAWDCCLKALLNIQANAYTQAESLMVLGTVDCQQEINQAEAISKQDESYYKKLGQLVEQIDKKVTRIISEIISAKKIPIIIGGGHNNSYGNLKGASMALNKAVNSINFDAHSDFRALEERHSGNGFSYAFNESFLDKYFVFGLHRNYSSEAVFKNMDNYPDRIGYILFEDLAIKNKISFSQALKQAENFICDTAFGIEIDLDAIQNFPSSAMTPSGFSMNSARRFLNYFATHKNATYIHLCEAAPNANNQTMVGKALAYLISDVMTI